MVWDYAGQMQFMCATFGMRPRRRPGGIRAGRRKAFSTRQPEPSSACSTKADHKAWRSFPLRSQQISGISMIIRYIFSQRPGCSPGLLMSLSDEQQASLRERIRAELPYALDGWIPLVARAWAVRVLGR